MKSVRTLYAPCPYCGERVGGPGIGQHQKGQACNVRRQVNALHGRGLFEADVGQAPPTNFLKDLCADFGIEAEVAPSKYERGKLYYSTYLPEWAANVWRCSVHLDFHVRRELLQRARDEELFRWGMYAASLAGPEQVGHFLTMLA